MVAGICMLAMKLHWCAALYCLAVVLDLRKPINVDCLPFDGL